MKLQDKVAIITGGSRGIGKAVAKEFVKEGAKVMLAARTEEALKATAEELQASYTVCDVANEEQPKNLIQQTLDKLGKIDIVVTAAGIQKPLGRFHELSLQEWKKTIDINLMGTVNVIHAALPHMQQGSVITLAGAGVPKAFPNFSAYSTSKIAIIQLITNLAEEYPNIRFNAIAPGPVNTQFTDEVLRAGPEVVGQEFYDKNIAWQKGEQGAVSPGIAAEFMVRLVSGEINCTGKYLSAVWDKEFDTNPDMYTLKRIDGRNFGKK